MKLLIIYCALFPGLLLHYPSLTVSFNVFFNGSSQIQVTGRVIPLCTGFDFSFRTCHGGILLSQSGTGNGLFLLRVVLTSVNYSISPPHLISSHLEMTWKIGNIQESVSLGKDLDQNVVYKVQFTPGNGVRNSTLQLDGLETFSVDISDGILNFENSGPLYAGFDPISGEAGFVGCMESGANIDLTPSATSVDVSKNCSLDKQIGCPVIVCSPGFTGYYCEVNIDDCGSLPCHHHSTCIDLVNNYTCQCGPRWTGYHCDIYLGSPCNESNNNNMEICQNGGICHETVDKNNYTCICTTGYTGRNCESKTSPCDSSPCEHGGICSVFLDDFKCTCPQGFTGKSCDININDCFNSPCLHGLCVDGINNFTCNCTGSGYSGETCSKDINECEPVKPCHPNASCVNYAGTYKCNCHPGFTGKNCYEDINDCANTPCQHGGSCKDQVDGFTCECSVGFNGTFCETNIDDCVTHTCNNYSNCLDGISNYTCVCKPGYTGSNCTSDIDECDPSPCQNGGSCTQGINWYTCACPPQYNGSKCEFDAVNDCIGDPCANNATCVDGFHQFNCTCLPGFEGLRCENETDECLNFPCLNNSTCTDQLNNFTCNCTAGFAGHTCAENVDDCLSAPCENNATCVDGVNEYSCRCAAAFYGNLCQYVRDVCHPNPCDNGNCSFVGDSYNCTCISGFQGVNCSININDCRNDSCVSNATCLDGVNNFTCQCPPGYMGEHCQIEIDECVSNPCLNNGACKDGINGYNCSCSTGFTGTRCEINIDDCPTHGCNNGTCIDGVNNFTCRCNAGFTGPFCDSDIDECLGTSCNTGTCINVPGSYRCQCDQWTSGARCDSDIDECKANPCNSPSGHCVNCDGTSAVTQAPCQLRKGFECFCRNGVTGPFCSVEVDECKQYSPCRNGATCKDESADYSCICAPGYKGRNCSVEIDECEFGFCQNGAVCLDFINGYNCTCAAGFTDYNCSTNIDDCEGDPCEHGNCTDLINDFNCTCFPGYTGRNCTVDIDECISNPCQNNGTCVNLIAAVNCSCTANYTGEFCQFKVSPCSPENPCLNNGSCVEKNFNYTCDCVPGYGGGHCENVTTIGLNGSAYMTFPVARTAFALSLQFRTTLSRGILAADSTCHIVVFLDGSVVHVLYNGTRALSAGSAADLSNGDWHRVVVNMSVDVVTLQVDNSSCGRLCDASADLPSPQPRITDLFIGGLSLAAASHQFVLTNFTGCIQDVVIDNRTVIPTETGVELWNSSVECPRAQVCASNPCVHGQCIDEWITSSCECARPWVGSDCNTSLVPGTFGATDPLNSLHSRRRRDAANMRNVSYAKFLTNGAVFGDSTEFSFFIRTREISGLIAFMTNGVDEHIGVGLVQGAVVFQVTLQGAKTNVTLGGNVSDGMWHFVLIKGNASQFDNQSQSIGAAVVNKDVVVNVTYIGGLENFSLYPEASLVRAPFRGCIQDMRLGKKLFDFGFDPSFLPAERVQLVDQRGLGEGCVGMNVCRTFPCGQGGYCRDLWNQYQCECKPRYGAEDCSLYGCALVNLCPSNATCWDVNQHYECVHPASFNGTETHAEFTLNYNGVVKPDGSLKIRTRQTTTDLIVVQKDNEFVWIGVSGGRVNVSFSLGGNNGEVLSGVMVNDGSWHAVVFNITNNATQVTVDGLTNHSATGLEGGSLGSLLLNGTAVLLGGRSAFKGCLYDVRIGGLLLPFVDYYNSSINVSHVTPQKPHFNINSSGLRLGCHSDAVCSPNPCVRGVCGDVWNQFTCACPEGWAGRVCNLTANMTCAHSPCANGTCANVTNVAVPTNQSQVSDVGYDMFYCNCTPGFEGKQCEEKTNECSSNPCKHGANCTDLHLNYTCTCAAGYTGRDCETNIDDCQNNNCSEHATCVDGVNEYNCSCLAGFEGTYCEKDINECLTINPPYGPCNATGTTNCTNGYGNFTCVCKNGHFGEFCQYDPSMACISNPCRNGGTCLANATGFNCSCPTGYNGTFCQFDIHECKDEPCMNNGTCMDSHRNPSGGHFVGYNCTCTVDYTGRRCEEFIDPCDSRPCENNASCQRLAHDEYRCNCTPDYEGENCTVFLPCYSSPCENGGTCDARANNYSCSCALGYYGRNCQNEVDYCAPDPCRNNATCVNVNTEGAYYCNCTEGFGNVNCSGLLKFCFPDDPCLNGTCIPLMDGFHCDCKSGFQGEKCDQLIETCDSNPCMNGGTCTPVANSYTCSCAENWVGTQCTVANPCSLQLCDNGFTCLVDKRLGNHTCVCPPGETCGTPVEPTDPSESTDDSLPPLHIVGIVAVSVLFIVFCAIVVILLYKRCGNSAYKPSELEREGGRVELDAIMKPPPPERLI